MTIIAIFTPCVILGVIETQLVLGQKVWGSNSFPIPGTVFLSLKKKKKTATVEKHCTRRPDVVPCTYRVSQQEKWEATTATFPPVVDSTPGRVPLQRWRKLTFLFRSSNNVAFKMLLTLHNSTHGALHTRLWGSASKLWPLWQGCQHVVQRARWMEMSSSQWQVYTGLFFFFWWSLADVQSVKPIYIQIFLPSTSLDSRKTHNFTKVRKVVFAPLIFFHDAILRLLPWG